MARYEVMAIITLEGKPKTDIATKGRVGMIGKPKFYDMPDNNVRMCFMSEKYFKGFITSRIVNDREEVDGYITKRVITTRNSIYILKELKEV